MDLKMAPLMANRTVYNLEPNLESQMDSKLDRKKVYLRDM